MTLKPTTWVALSFGALALAIVTVYLPGLHSPFVLDDLYFFLEGSFFTRGFADVLRQFAVRILPSATFWLDMSAHGPEQPWAWRAENIALHLMVTAVVYGLARELFKGSGSVDSAATDSRMPALFVAILFGLHPIQTQAVTYVWQRQASMAALFYFSSIWAYVCLCAHEAERDRQGARRWLIAMLGLGALAMVCKQNTVTLPLTLIMVHYLALGDLPNGPRAVRPIIACGALVAIPVLLGVLFSDMAAKDIENTALRTLSTPVYAANQIVVVWRYLGLFFWPASQAFVHDIIPITDITSPYLFALLVGHVVVLSGAILLRHRRPRTAFGVLFFYLTLLPESSVIPLEDLMFEHRLYLPSLGLCVAVVDLSLWALERLRGKLLKMTTPTAALAGAVTVAAALGIRTFERNKIWTSERLLWEEVAAAYPTSLRAALSLAFLDSKTNDCGAAIKRLIAPDLAVDNASPRVVAGALFLRGHCLAVNGADAAAEQSLRSSIEIFPANPAAQHTLATLLARQGHFDEAVKFAQSAAALSTRDLAPHLTLAMLLEDTGNQGEALAAIKAAVALEQAVPRAVFLDLEALAQKLGDADLAAKAHQRAAGL